MSVEEKIRILLRVAARAEGEGNDRVARIFRRWACEVLPTGGDELTPEMWPACGLGA